MASLRKFKRLTAEMKRIWMLLDHLPELEAFMMRMFDATSQGKTDLFFLESEQNIKTMKLAAWRIEQIADLLEKHEARLAALESSK